MLNKGRTPEKLKLLTELAKKGKGRGYITKVLKEKFGSAYRATAGEHSMQADIRRAKGVTIQPDTAKFIKKTQRPITKKRIISAKNYIHISGNNPLKGGGINADLVDLIDVRKKRRTIAQSIMRIKEIIKEERDNEIEQSPIIYLNLNVTDKGLQNAINETEKDKEHVDCVFAEFYKETQRAEFLSRVADLADYKETNVINFEYIFNKLVSVRISDKKLQAYITDILY